MEWTEARLTANGATDNSFDNIWLTLGGQYTSKSGLSIYAAAMEDYASWSGTNNPAGLNGDFSNFGALVQAGYLINPNWEAFARYGLTLLASRYARILGYGTQVVPNGTDQRAVHNIHEFTVGVNYQLFGQRAKITGVFSFLPTGSPVNAVPLGVLRNDDHTEWVGRVPFQLML
ncbi:MAG: hypothetical protein ABSB42_22895 [Tepidisphaeraceae bacterium]|jgi:hypothetical protein